MTPRQTEGAAVQTRLLELLFKRIEVRATLSPAEKQLLAGAFDPNPTILTPGSDLVREGDRPTKSTLLIRGFAVRYRLLETGRRQITALHVPGDFVDLQSFPLRLMDHSVGALTECVTMSAPHSALIEIVRTSPRLTMVLWTLTLLDSAIHREWIVAMGAMQALAHTAHFICEVYLRLRSVGLATEKNFAFPVTQTELADALGISPVHVNRVLQELRRDNLIRFEDGWVTILDWDRLAATGQFDDKHLHLGNEGDATAATLQA
jgi:CRP-like cAMP-binding protein